MKFVKRLVLNRYNQMSDRFAVLADGRIVTNTRVAMEVPVGNETTDRPIPNINGYVRYNDDLKEFEVYNGSTPGIGWEKIRTVRPAPISVCRLGDGNYSKTRFGPLRYDSLENYTDTTRPQNIFVYIENVFQIPVTNYTLVLESDQTVSILFASPPPNKPVVAILGYDGYFPAFPSQG